MIAASASALASASATIPAHIPNTADLAVPAALMAYQQRWVADTSPLKVIEKSRRTGLTWGEASDNVLTAAASRSAGGQNVYYIAYNQDMTIEYIQACAMWARVFNYAAGEIEEGLWDDDEDDKHIKTFTIRFPASGFRIVALSSRPSNLRGRQGTIVIDEAAFHDQLEELLKAALAMLIWGGRVRVISTHNGDDNPFNDLVKDTGSILIKCTAILSPNRIRIAANLVRTLGPGVLTRCSMDQIGTAHATAQPGDIWLGRQINMGNDMDGGAVVVRRSLNSAEARLYFIDAYTPNWTERMWSSRRQGGDIPAGFADYEYAIPMRGDGNLRMDIEVEGATINHIVALSAATGLGGFTNPAMRPATPVMATPAAAATNITERPTLSVASYSSPGGSAQSGVQFQVSKVNTFVTLQHDSGQIAAGLSYQLPAGVLIANTVYYIRARVKDVAGLWSDWAAFTSFTTAATFAYVASPTLVSPANNAIDIGEQPIMQTGAFAVVGGTSTHAASQWQVRTAAGIWTAPAWDSAEDAVNLLSRTVPAGILAAGQQQYFMRARHKGSTLGWSEWSNEIKITTKQVYANIAGVVLVSSGGDGGTWAYIDADGNTVANPGTAYFNAHPVFGGIQDVTVDGQIMVKVPKFYRKRAIIASGANAGKEGRWISDQPIAGYTIHPAFRSAGVDIDQFWYGKYQASKTGTKLESKPAVLPVVSISLTDVIAAAAARNVSGVTGFMSLSFYQEAAIQWLYLVENATMNSQTKTGAGRTSASSAANVDATDVAQATYRGIVGLWGNVYQWIDGMKTVSGVVNLWDKDGNKTWVNTGKKRTAADGTIYPTTFITGFGAGYDFDDIFIGDTGPTSNTAATAPDYQYFTSSGEYFPFVGGDWSTAAVAGLWCVDCTYAAANAYTSFGARLAKV